MTIAMDLFRLDGKVALAVGASRYVSGAKHATHGGFTINAGV